MTTLRPAWGNSLAYCHEAGGDGTKVPDSAVCPQRPRFPAVSGPGIVSFMTSASAFITSPLTLCEAGFFEKTAFIVDT